MTRGPSKNRKTDRFIEQALATETDDCIIWPYAKLNHRTRFRMGSITELPSSQESFCERTYGPPQP